MAGWAVFIGQVLSAAPPEVYRESMRSLNGMREAIPTPDDLGPGWTRVAPVLFDAHCETNAVPDPGGNISGWASVQYRFESAERTNRYDVQVHRYRSKERLIDDFDQVWALDSGRYERSKDTATPLLPEGTERFEDDYEVIGPELRL